ncbi:MAG: crossover junction endodeoxyribonuclease RuvC [Candidatus Colwellbacteria bacterium]|nr:crossover junction endodeoxyribonuclease RuvC [Candidatus Colwellbacteria bacterium]
MKSNKEKVILGIDPGTNRIGFGIIQAVGRKVNYVDSGLIEIKEKYAPEQLKKIFDCLNEVIRRYSPDSAAVEKLFFAKNQKTAMNVSEARGCIMLTLALAGVPIVEISPNEVKSSVTGYGHADKAAVLKMVNLILGSKGFHPIDDTSDALAIAIAAASSLAPNSDV